MIPFVQLPYRKSPELEEKPGIRPLLVAVILGFILCLQVGLVLWVFYKQW
jgi:hypothetical protein